VQPTTRCGNCTDALGGTVDPGKFYIIGNYVYGNAAVTADNWQGVNPDESSKLDLCRAETRWTEGLTTMTNEQTAEEAYETVLAKAGCSLHRDAIDMRIVEEVRNGTYTYKGSNGSTNGLIDSPSDVGGYPTLNSTEAPKDTDRDGMPDEWEIANGLDQGASSDSKLYTLDKKYTNLEVYINGLVRDLY
jgi:hypothetical protein